MAEKTKPEKEVKKLEDYKTMGEKTETKIEKEVSEDVSKSAVEKEIMSNAEKIKQKAKEEKIELEREYIVPLRRKVMKAPRYTRAKKAIRVLKEFLAKHMKVEDRDLRKIKINKWLNQELWFRGIKNPPAKIKIKAVKIAGIVYVELAEIPDKVKWDIEKEKKKFQKLDKVALKQIAKKEKKEAEEKKKVENETVEDIEKEKSAVEAGLREQKQEAKTIKHTPKLKQPKQQQIQRKALKR